MIGSWDRVNHNYLIQDNEVMNKFISQSRSSSNQFKTKLLLDWVYSESTELNDRTIQSSIISIPLEVVSRIRQSSICGPAWTILWSIPIFYPRLLAFRFSILESQFSEESITSASDVLSNRHWLECIARTRWFNFEITRLDWFATS